MLWKILAGYGRQVVIIFLVLFKLPLSLNEKKNKTKLLGEMNVHELGSLLTPLPSPTHKTVACLRMN